ncbi:RNA polymerase II transcriptional coactivator KELP [Tanacetum coccineum]
MESTTEYKVRKSASEKLGIDLSEPERKKLVKNVVQTYLEQQQDNEVEEEEEEEEEGSEEDEKKKVGGKEYDDDGDLILCRLSNKRRVTLTEFKGKSLVSIREYYMKDGKELPSSKGMALSNSGCSVFSGLRFVVLIDFSIRAVILFEDCCAQDTNVVFSISVPKFIDVVKFCISLTAEQWSNFSKNVPAIEKAIKKMEAKC